MRHKSLFWGGTGIARWDGSVLKHEIPKHAARKRRIILGNFALTEPCYECENEAIAKGKSRLFLIDSHDFFAPTVLYLQVEQSCVQDFLVQCVQSPRSHLGEMPGLAM